MDRKQKVYIITAFSILIVVMFVFLLNKFSFNKPSKNHSLTTLSSETKRMHPVQKDLTNIYANEPNTIYSDNSFEEKSLSYFEQSNISLKSKGKPKDQAESFGFLKSVSDAISVEPLYTRKGLWQ